MTIDPSEYQQRLNRLSSILGEITEQAQTQSATRCPYKDAQDQCTAKFGCRFQRQPPAEAPATGETNRPDRLLLCTHDNTLDYRSAWESDPEAVERARAKIKAAKQRETKHCPAVAEILAGEAHDSLVAGESLFDHADRLKVRVPSSCGRTGLCHECIVEVQSGASSLSSRTEAESFLSDRYRLACQAIIESTEEPIEFSQLRRTPKILTEQRRRDRTIDPAVTRRDDQVFWHGERIDSYRGHLFGIAIDLGTTTVVAELVDLESGDSRYVASFENPQRFGGSDILNRISYDSGEFQGELHKAIINTLNTEIERLCEATGIDRHLIYEILVVGNSTMRDLLFGLDVQSIGQRPYRSTTEQELRAGERATTALTELARKLRIRANKNARVYGVPLIASHVGADTVADLVAIDAEQHAETMMLVDIGTNTEVVLGNRDRLMVASCPAGPAFEGGLVEYGMPACDGAIEAFDYRDGRFHYRTIGDGVPRGICGSGLIDLLAELKRSGQMGPKGIFSGKQMVLDIVPEHGITFSRQDASHLAQAKSANYCGQRILMRKYGVEPAEISQLYLAGGFAHYVDVDAAIEIGFLPPVPHDRVVKLGNAASQGARELLLSCSQRESIERLVKSIEHVELETVPDFFEQFCDGCLF